MAVFAVLTAAAAQVAIPVPGSPVPITLQTLVVLLAGVTLGPRLGALAMGFYLLLGTVGYHVFAAGTWGFQTVAGATGGYLLGFVLAQPIVGRLTEPGRRVGLRVLAAALAGNVVIFAAGLLWLSAWMDAGLEQTLRMGFWPFVPGLVVKTALATGLGSLLAPTVRRWLDGCG